MWAWVLHRICGATIFFFLFVHVVDTALVRVSPQAYNYQRLMLWVVRIVFVAVMVPALTVLGVHMAQRFW